MGDKYYINHLFDLYYPYISYGGVLLYLNLIQKLEDGQCQVEVSMSELTKDLGMSHETLHKYEILCSLMGLLQIQRVYYPNDVAKEGVPQGKIYTIYKPLSAPQFRDHVKMLSIPKLERVQHLDPSKNKRQFASLEKILNHLFRGEKPTGEGQKQKLPLQPFRPGVNGDVFGVDSLFKIYTFLPKRSVIFYLYMLQQWQRRLTVGGVHISRRTLKKRLNYGDEQIRKSMYVLSAAGLMDIEKRKYYIYHLRRPRELDNLKVHISNGDLPLDRSHLEFMTPLDVKSKNEYYDLYDMLDDGMYALIT